MNALDRSSTLIANKAFRFSGRGYSPGDKFEYKRLGYAQRRKVVRLVEGPERKLVELTPASMASALKRRESARPPRGFTLAGLVGLGILTEEQIQARGWGFENREVEAGDEQAPWVGPEGSWQVFPDGDESNTADAMWVVPFKTGGAPRYFVHDADGKNVSGEASINGKDKATEAAQNYIEERAKQRLMAGEADKAWADLPENPEDWSDEQVEAFSTWFDGASDEDVAKVEHAGVQQVVQERRDAAAAEDAKAVTERFAGMSDVEARDFAEGLDDDELRAFVESQQGKEPGDLSQISRLGLLDMAADIHVKAKEDSDVSDVQSESGNAD